MVHHNLQMPLRLHVCAHHAEGADGSAVSHEKARDDRVVGALAGTQDVCRRGIEREVRAAVLQRDAGAVHDDAGAEAHIVRLDIRDHVPLAVGAAEIDRSALRREGGDVRLCPRRDLAGTHRAVLRRDQIMIVQLHALRIRHIPERVGKGELHRLDLVMVRAGIVLFREIKVT